MWWARCRVAAPSVRAMHNAHLLYPAVNSPASDLEGIPSSTGKSGNVVEIDRPFLVRPEPPHETASGGDAPARRPANPTVSVVVPTRNEADNLRVVLPRIPAEHQVIVVDGGSTDDTVRVARQVRPDALVIQQTRRGKGNAMVCGFHAATGDVLVMLDADGSADPDEIERFVAALTAGADFAKGSRYITGGGSDDLTPIRSLGNKFLSTVANVLFARRFTDLCYGYNAFWRDLLPMLSLPEVDLDESTPVWGDGFEIEAVINCRMAGSGVKISEVPSMELDRIHGESNLLPVSDGLRILRTIATERFRRAPRNTRSLSHAR